MLLIVLAVIGLLSPGGLFMLWVHHDYTTLSAALADWLAMAYFLDLVMAAFLLAYLFAKKPIGPVKWYWFIPMALLGTLAFAIPFFVWLNWRRVPEPRPAFAAWWRTA
jgi:hypothetical protein